MVTKLTQWPHTPLGGPRERANRVAAACLFAAGMSMYWPELELLASCCPDGYFQQAS